LLNHNVNYYYVVKFVLEEASLKTGLPPERGGLSSATWVGRKTHKVNEFI
jgi:hypothetical protein